MGKKEYDRLIKGNALFKRRLGEKYEKLAARHLQRNGLSLVDRNFHGTFGEIDLIMLDGSEWVFVEVKYRSQDTFGGAIAALTHQKLLKVQKTAEQYLMKQNLNSNLVSYRIDLVAIDGSHIQWIRAVDY